MRATRAFGGGVALFALMACAPATVSEPAKATPPRPHVVSLDGASVGCPKTSTVLSLEGAWDAREQDGATVLSSRVCKAVIVARAGHVRESDALFERDWAIVAKFAPEAEHGEMRSHAAEIDVAHTTGFRFERDQLASLTCSFMFVGDPKCERFVYLSKAPRSLREPNAPKKEKPTRYMGPAEGPAQPQ